MRTFPVLSDHGTVRAFEIDNVLVSASRIGTILLSIPEVTNLSVRRPFSPQSDWLVRFEFRGRRFFVTEPFGDNSRLWIGPEDQGDCEGIESLLAAIRSYEPPLWRKFIGALVAPNTIFNGSRG